MFSISVRVRKSASLKCNCATSLVTCTETPIVATPSLDALSIRALPSSTRPDRVGKSSGKGARFLWPSGYTAGPRRPRRRQNPNNGFSRYFLRNKRKRKRSDGENMREREKPRKTASGIFSKRHSTPLLQPHHLLRRKDGVFVKYASFSTRKCSADRWTPCRSVTARCKVMRERQIHSPRPQKGPVQVHPARGFMSCSGLRSTPSGEMDTDGTSY